MDRPTDLEELNAAWRALRMEVAADGWRTISVAAESPCPVLAGREFPQNEEALIVGFKSVQRPPPDSLPQSDGFTVTCPDLGKDMRSHVWIALVRQRGGEFDLFSMMSGDVVRSIYPSHMSADADDKSRLGAFIDRIRAWQEFMQQRVQRVLSPDEEIGLTGELELINTLLNCGMPGSSAVSAWRGPRRGLHDFAINMGAIETKATIDQGRFPANISSLDQLDDSRVRPLFVAAVRLVLGTKGRTLPEYVQRTRDRLRSDQNAKMEFDCCLIQAGFLDPMSDFYIRRFALESLRLLRVSPDFPRLTQSTVPRQVRRAAYEIDLDQVPDLGIDIAEALRELRAVR